MSELSDPKAKSPLTGGAATYLKTIPFESLASLYRSKLDFDLFPFQNGVEETHLFRCAETSYQFFSPAEIMGTPDFYEALYGDGRNTSWAYQDSKWEYEIAASFVINEAKVLDVGSGAGQFLSTLEKITDHRAGLETNPLGRKAAADAGIFSLDETVEVHATKKPEFYDVVTAIQVLEHVYDVRSFLDGCCPLLKPGGVLVISVPNNDGFVGAQADLPLNQPPHHMGRWSRKSLSALAQVLQLELMRIEFEPLQKGILGWYQSSMEARYLPKSKFARTVYYRFGFANGVKKWLSENHSTIHGHTVLAAYQKPQANGRYKGR